MNHGATPLVATPVHSLDARETPTPVDLERKSTMTPVDLKKTCRNGSRSTGSPVNGLTC